MTMPTFDLREKLIQLGEKWMSEDGREELNDLLSEIEKQLQQAYEAGQQAPSAVPDGWQPIETAPKDGSHVQLYRHVIQFVGYYGGAESGWRINAPGLLAMWPEPTHWMPLPAAPKERK